MVIKKSPSNKLCGLMSISCCCYIFWRCTGYASFRGQTHWHFSGVGFFIVSEPSVLPVDVIDFGRTVPTKPPGLSDWYSCYLQLSPHKMTFMSGSGIIACTTSILKPTHNAKRGFFFSHVGWLLMKKHPDVINRGKYLDVSNLLADKIVVIHKKWGQLILLQLFNM